MVAQDLSRQCVILVGGLGTRLGPLTQTCPKPMLEVAGRPFVEHLIDHVARFGFDDIILLAGRHGGIMADHFAAGKLGQATVRVMVEPAPLGTAGALTMCRDLLAPCFLMINGDSLFDINLLDLATRHHDGHWLARLALRQVAEAVRFGTVETQPDGTVTAFHERPSQPGPGRINGGIYWLRRELVERITTTPLSLERDVLPALAAEGLVCGWEYDSFFIDIGVPEEFAASQATLPQALRRPAVFFDCDGVLNHDAGYPHKIAEIRWIEGAIATIKLYNDHGYLVFVVTTKSGAAHGYYDDAMAQRLHAVMNDQLRTFGAHVDDFHYCPPRPEGTAPADTFPCDSCKPEPNMITALMAKWPIDPARSLLISDNASDLAAAAAAGLSGHLLPGHLFSDGDLDSSSMPYHRVATTRGMMM